jgi:transcriptional regulator with XRE-family HTH domain
MADHNHQQKFADRLRSLRLAADLTIEQASERAGLSPGFWGEVERNAKEPCLNSLYGFAKAFDLTTATLFTFDEHKADSDEHEALLAQVHLLKPDQARLARQILQLIYYFNSAKKL